MYRNRWQRAALRVWQTRCSVLVTGDNIAPTNPMEGTMKKSMLVLAMAAAAVFGPVVADAESPTPDAQGRFSFELEEAQTPHRGKAVEGYVYNGSAWRITNVRLRVESLDDSGAVKGEGSGWVVGDVKAGGRGYFFVLVAPGAASYRATVQSFDRVAREAPHMEAP